MNTKYTLLLAVLLSCQLIGLAQKSKQFHVLSPDRKIDILLDIGDGTQWSVRHENTVVIAASPMSLTLDNGEVLGNKVKIVSSKAEQINTSFNTPVYKKKTVVDNYNQLTIHCSGDYGIIIRAYNDGAAYRFFTKRKGEIIVQSEQANFNFDKDYTAFIPYVRDLRAKGDLFSTSFEALYDEINISQFRKDTLAFLPVLVNIGDNKKAVITEADLEDYPGMYINVNPTNHQSLQGVYAPYPLEEKQGGYNMLNNMVVKRANYIAKVNGNKNFPWRVLVISDNDAALANNDMVQKLASPCRLADISWIQPGKVAWDWWNDWNITHVDFRAGINTDTYKYYIDFAAANKLEYIVLDEGWSKTDDLMNISSRINLEEIVNYGKQKNVGVILWATWFAVTQKMDEAFAKYSAMGVKGFKIDFMDRDDEKLVASLYQIAQHAADHHLLVDLHGMYKPTGLQRTFPNLINFEGVKGMENVKWTPADDVPRYDVTIPFIRMLAGPMDYTPGAMRNATRSGFRPSNSLPMSQGTRCHQLAMYIVFEAPLQMLADNPTVYMKEQECTNFIAGIPTVYDETVALTGKVGEYVAIARKKDNIWYTGAMTNWTPRDITIDCSFLGEGNYEAEIFRDGINADRDATDYKRETIALDAAQKLTIHLAPGGGMAMRIIKK